ncbi:MAG: hypothetical protein KDC80_23140, partial [Saprospiraceae bacterium]|nr:hypothetical protein [Saprospiraceae bacterium]
LGEAEFATWQIDGSCFQAHYIGGEKRGDFFYDGENDAVGMDFFPASSEVATGGILVNQLLSLAAFQTIAVLGPEAFLSLVTANTAGGDIITNAINGSIATRMTSIQDGGGVILVYDNGGQEKIRLGCDQSGEAGIWFGSERVLGGTAQAQLGPKVTDEGTIQLIDGQASVYYDKIFTSTSTEEKMVIALTPLSSESQGLAVVEKFNGGFKIKELNNGKGSYLVDWTVTSKKSSAYNKKEALQKIEVPQRWSSMSKMKSMRDIKKFSSDNR